MSLREGTVAGKPARIARISFSGELAYEINVPADWARHVWEALMDAGRPHGITPYGTEAMHVLRAEKGYIIVGQDTDGSVTPADLGMAAMVNKTKDCIGQRSLVRADTSRPDRKQLVGLLSKDPSRVVPEGSQIIASASGKDAQHSLGYVTSSYFSSALGRSIALALVQRGRERSGERLFVAHHQGAPILVTITSPVFYDPEGARQHV